MNSFPEREISPLVDLPCPCSGLAALHVRSHLTLKMTYDGKKKEAKSVKYRIRPDSTSIFCFTYIYLT